MISFTLHILIALSLGSLLYLIAKTIPRIDDTTPKELSFREHWVTRKVEHVDKKIKTSSEKFLRRLGLVLLKWENKVNKKVARLKEEAAKEANNILIVEERPRKETPTNGPKKKEEKKKKEAEIRPPVNPPNSSRNTKKTSYIPVVLPQGIQEGEGIKRGRKRTKNNPPATDIEGRDSSSSVQSQL